MFKRIPFIKILALAQIAKLANDHYRRLDPTERRQLLEFARRPRDLTAADKAELKRLVGKMEPGAFAGGAARHATPFGRRR